MKEISISILFQADEELNEVAQIDRAKDKYLKNIEMTITDINFEKEWIAGKTRITFKGVET